MSRAIAGEIIVLPTNTHSITHIVHLFARLMLLLSTTLSLLSLRQYTKHSNNCKNSGVLVVLSRDARGLGDDDGGRLCQRSAHDDQGVGENN